MRAELPASVAPFAGRIVDCDSHELMPAQVWVETFGEVARPIAEFLMAKAPQRNLNFPSVKDFKGDILDLTPETLWNIKGPTAPGSVDMHRRIDVMDMMSVDRSLIFPTSVGLHGIGLLASPPDSEKGQIFKENSKTIGRKLITANNEWMVGAARVSTRLRPVTPVFGDTPEELMAVTKSLVDRGIRAIVMITGQLPGGVSPAHNDLDPFYAMLEEANVTLTMHIGSEASLFRTIGWGKATAFEGYKINDESSLDPWRLSTMHFAPQNFLSTMITGGAFDRHPKLRVGVLEYGAYWIGQMADTLDLWHENNQAISPRLFADGSSGRRLPMKPSEYINRNIRVAPFDFESIGKYMSQYPQLENVYCFGSDYPHVEGGKDPIGMLAKSLEPLGSMLIEKFFVTNGEWILPA